MAKSVEIAEGGPINDYFKAKKVRSEMIPQVYVGTADGEQAHYLVYRFRSGRRVDQLWFCIECGFSPTNVA